MSYETENLIINTMLERVIEKDRELQSMRAKLLEAYAARDVARGQVRELQAKLDGYLTVEDAFEKAVEETGYVFDDEAPNGVSPTVVNEAVYGEQPPTLWFRMEEA